MTRPLHDGWRVRVVGPSGRYCGAGVLITPDTVLTCAHVVACAARARAAGPRPPDGVTVEFVTAEHVGRVHGTVTDEGWVPVRPDHSGDLALVRLEREVVIAPAVLARCGPPVRRQVRVFGNPRGGPVGRWASAQITGTAGPAGEWVHLTDPNPGGPRIEPGFSGAGVIDEASGRVIGMVVGSDREASVKGAWMISVEAVAERLPPVRSLLVDHETGSRSRLAGPPDPVRLDYERAVVDALSMLDGMDSRDHRDDLVRELERRLNAPLHCQRRPRARSDLLNVVVACLDHPSGNVLGHLVAAVRALHDEERVLRRLHELLAQDPHRRLTVNDIDRLVALAGETPRGVVSHAATVAFGSVGPPVDVNQGDPAQLIRALSQLIGDAGQLPPLLHFLHLLADSPATSAVTEQALREWVAVLAGRWQIRLTDRMPPTAADVVTPTRSYYVVELREDPPAPERYLLSIWLQHETDAGITGLGLLTNDEQPLTIDEVVGYVGKHLRRVVAQHLGPIGPLTVEFVLPYWLLSHPVDQFRLILDDRPRVLGAAYPVVVRSLDRLHDDAIHHRWRSRWQYLKSRLHGVDPAALKLVRPPGAGPRAVEDELRRGESDYSEEYPGCLVLAPPRRGERALLGILQEVLNLGMPVLLWCRVNRLTDRFVVEMANQLNGRPVAEVPALVQRLRHQAALPDSPADDLGAHVSLLWDDADRVPPRGPFHAPN